MRKDLIPEMEEFNKMDKGEQIDTLCAVHECSEKIRKVHRDQYVKRQWNPHPPMRFVYWWAHDGASFTESKTNRSWVSIDAVRAFNCEAAREAYREAKSVGLVEAVPNHYEPKARLVEGT